MTFLSVKCDSDFQLLSRSPSPFHSGRAVVLQTPQGLGVVRRIHLGPVPPSDTFLPAASTQLPAPSLQVTVIRARLAVHFSSGQFAVYEVVEVWEVSF